MIEALLGKKIGMTHLFGAEARLVPVTVLEVGPCVVTQVRTGERDGYEAAQIGFGEAKSLNKPAAGHQAAANTRLRHLREVPVLEGEVAVGQTITVRQFQPGDVVDVTANAKGRGFQGVVKRHNYGGGPKTHGQGDRHRAVGSIGAGTSPGRVLKGKTMPGHMGDNRVTVRHLKVVSVDADRNLLLVRGAVPGARNGTVLVRFSRGLPVAERVAAEAAEQAEEKES
jgi:large subunit ribosomal protein L3